MAEGGPKARRKLDPKKLRRELHPKKLWKDHRRICIGLAVGLVLGIVGAVIAYNSLKRPADVHNPDAVFKPEKPKKQVRVRKTVNWPLYGYDRARTRYLPVKGVRPPFEELWRYTDRPLLEFPPVVAGGRLYFVNNNGFAFALDAETGKTVWTRRIGELNASSPAYSRGFLYIVNLAPGHVLKLDAKTGKTVWKRDLPGRSESSPVVVGRSVYFGCEDGRLYSLSTKNGNQRWATSLGGEVKAAPAYYGGDLFVGDYGGYMNSVDARTGKLNWQSGSLGPGFGGTGAFYSTPAVAFGRVYAGNNDSRVYSFEVGGGELAWSYSTGGYAYSGPAVARNRHSGPTVYIGSFDGNVYALNAESGEPRWIESAGGSVIGSLVVIGNIVYVAEFSDTSTTGYSVKTGRTVFRYPRGTYTPVVSDGRRLYLVGYSSITALEPYKYEARISKAFEAPEGVVPKPKPKPKPEPAAQAKRKPTAEPKSKSAKRHTKPSRNSN